MSVKKTVLIIIGCVSLGLGTVGVFLPILPTVPFYLLATICFANSSQKLHDWFVSTDLYKKNLDSYVKKKGMTVRTKVSILASVTLLMTVGFIMMKRVPVGRIILAAVWVCHVIYFVFGVKTIKEG